MDTTGTIERRGGGGVVGGLLSRLSTNCALLNYRVVGMNFSRGDWQKFRGGRGGVGNRGQQLVDSTDAWSNNQGLMDRDRGFNRI